MIVKRWRSLLVVVCQIWLLTIIAAATELAQAQQPQVRTIPFDPAIPIADRLRPDDSVVVIEMLSGPPLTAVRAESFAAEIERLAKSDTIAVVDVLSTAGVWIDNGTWLRTQVTGVLSRLIKGDRTIEDRSGRVGFWHHNGETVLNGVRVVAGTYLQFERGKRYLLFLYPDRPVGLVVVQAFALGTDGQLERIRYSNGSDDSTATTLAGRGANEVIDALTRAK